MVVIKLNVEHVYLNPNKPAPPKMLPHRPPPSDEVVQCGTNLELTQNDAEIDQRKIRCRSEYI